MLYVVIMLYPPPKPHFYTGRAIRPGVKVNMNERKFVCTKCVNNVTLSKSFVTI